MAPAGRVATLVQTACKWSIAYGEGVFIIDQYEVRDELGQAVVLPEESIGGGGVFATCAARHFLPPAQCMLVIDHAHDMPSRMAAQLKTWGEGSVVWRERTDGKGVARAVNVYSGREIGEGHQSFRYITPPRQLTLRDIAILSIHHHPKLPLPEWIHVVVRLPRAVEITQEAGRIVVDGVEGAGEEVRRRTVGWRPKLAWEPLGVQPMTPEELAEWIEAARACAIVSPNLLEAQTILASASAASASYELEYKPGKMSSQDELVRVTQALYDLIQRPNDTAADIGNSGAHRTEPIVIVRAGALGSYTVFCRPHVRTHSLAFPAHRDEFYTPAYWRQDHQDRVKDATGGGNGFMGGLCAGMILANGDVREACLYGTVTASFAIEQRGLPVYMPNAEGVGQWNGDDPQRRLAELRTRIA